MGRQPSAIIIVRHGVRLDSTDSKWRENAEYPWDTPLNYGGWVGAQSLGNRIDRETQYLDTSKKGGTAEETDAADPPARKRRRIVIHSSPYKRCMQTSIAIAAGLCYPAPETPKPFIQSKSALARGINAGSEYFSNNGTPRSTPSTKLSGREHYELRADPWLGEWLTPSYYEDTKPPPPSNEIMKEAEKTLTTAAEDIKGADMSAFLPESALEDAPEGQENIKPVGGLRAMALAGHSMPHRTRSFGVDTTNSKSSTGLRRRTRTATYSPPVPTYSLAPVDSIPPGFVAHARDVAVTPDLKWDSAQMGWGDGGTYPEEWNEMHYRFRQGLQKMLAYYEQNYSTPDADDHDDEHENLILVLVTHQAGANALIRLITGAPALHDVGVASLTMAIRRPDSPSSVIISENDVDSSNAPKRKPTRQHSLDLQLSSQFTLKILASTDHLRQGANPLGLNSPRVGMSPALTAIRRQTQAQVEPLENFSIGDPIYHTNTARSTSAGGYVARPSNFWQAYVGGKMGINTNTGLWGSPTASPAISTPGSGFGTPIEEKEEEGRLSPRSGPQTPGLDKENRSVNSKADESSSAMAKDLLDMGLGTGRDATWSSPARSRSNTVETPGLWGSANPSLASLQGASLWGGLGGGGVGGGSVVRSKSPGKRTWGAVEQSP